MSTEIEGSQAPDAAQAAQGQQEQYSPGFIEKMASTQRALSGAGESVNTYSERSGSESSFNIEEAIANQSSGVQYPAGEAQAGESTPTTKGSEEATGPNGEIQGSESIETVQSKPAVDEATQAVVSSQMTGDINLGEKPEETGESQSQQPEFNFGDDFKDYLAKVDPTLTPDNFAQELPKLIEAKKSFEEASSQVTNFKTVFENMPADIYQAIEEWGKGNDYKSIFEQSNKIDFSKSFEDHGNKEMVDSFFEGKISQEEWEEFSDVDGASEVKAKVANYIDMAKDKYDIAKGKNEHEKSVYEANAAVFTQKRQSAFDTSRQDFPKRFEGKLPIQEDYIQEVDKVVQSKDSVIAMFFNPDGTHKPDAHARMAMAMGGEELVLSQAQALKNKLVSQAREEVLRTTPDSHQIRSSADHGKASEMQLAEEKATRRAEEILGKPKEQSY